MARAPEYRDFNAEETALARKYFVERMTAAGSQLKLKEAGDVVVAEANGDRIAVMPSRVREDGTLQLFIRNDGSVPHSEPSCKWTVVLEPNSSEAFFVDTDTLTRMVSAPQNMPISVHPKSQGWTLVVANAAWAKLKLFRKATVLGEKGDSFLAYRKVHLASKEEFCHLHVHSMYSFLDGVSTPEGIARRAMENGQPGIALTDHGCGYGLFKFYKACKEYGVKPLIGIEFYVVDDAEGRYTDANGNNRRFEYHTTVIAADQEGLNNLFYLATIAWKHAYYVPRISFGELIRHSKGLIVTSGCFKGPVAWHLQHFDAPAPDDLPILDAKGRPIYRRDPDYAFRIMKAFKDHLGDRYYVEVQNIDFQRYMAIVPEIIEMAQRLGIKIVVTNDCHYETEEDAALQAVLAKIAGQKDDGNRYDEKGVYFIRQRSEMECGLFTPDMFANTCEVMERCNVRIPLPGDEDFKFHFPDYQVEKDVDWEAFQASRSGSKTTVAAPTVPEDRERATHTHRDTSASAYDLANLTKNEKRRQVYDYIVSRGQEGATDEEIQKALDMHGNTQRPRRGELEAAKLICDSGVRRETASGAKAIVWVAVNAAGLAGAA